MPSKVIQEKNFRIKQKVGVKDARGVWPGLVMFQGMLTKAKQLCIMCLELVTINYSFSSKE